MSWERRLVEAKRQGERGLLQTWARAPVVSAMDAIGPKLLESSCDCTCMLRPSASDMPGHLSRCTRESSTGWRQGGERGTRQSGTRLQPQVAPQNGDPDALVPAVGLMENAACRGFRLGQHEGAYGSAYSCMCQIAGDMQLTWHAIAASSLRSRGSHLVHRSTRTGSRQRYLHY